ncbi:DUF362 domain-containing protein [Bacilliculturomica massiliensis]|uniref:DUF362 domain-containing protein n=1 Tax=Bacilliculturomica massiliensis TaxID=1917867 RepID=UPI0013EF1288|nr:DUF362 domain-containing protein [Bacilliculturomica massiliensis]
MPKVSIQRTKDHEYASIKEAVDKVIEQLGGLEDIIKPGYKVIIKPNLVATPTDRLSGGVTRWEVCMAVYEAVQAVGGIPVIAESAAAGADTESVIQKCGYQDLRDKGVPVIDLKDKANARCTVEVENGVVFNKINTWEMVRDADAIITVPVMKTHDQTEITLGMKNLKGLLVDTQKKDFHKQGLIEGVVDWCLHLKPVLEIIDGTYGQQGLGPIFGETKEMKLIIGSKDLVACEAVTGKIMGYEPKDVMITKSACERGFGEMDLDKIEVVGTQIKDVESRFKRSSEVEIPGIPESFNLIFSKDACTGCHNTVISALMDMKAQELFPYLENMNVCVGPVTKDMLPEDANAENTVCIGICCKKLADEMNFRWVVGCPPGNADVVKGILGDRLEYGVRYN